MIGGVLAAAAVSFFLNTAYYALASPMFTVQFARAEIWTELLIVQNLLYAGLLAYLYPFGYEGGHFAKEGARFGAVMGVVAYLPANLAIRASWQVPFDFPFVLSCFHAVAVSAAMGVILAWFHRGAAERASRRKSGAKPESNWYTW